MHVNIVTITYLLVLVYFVSVILVLQVRQNEMQLAKATRLLCIYMIDNLLRKSARPMSQMFVIYIYIFKLHKCFLIVLVK